MRTTVQKRILYNTIFLPNRLITPVYTRSGLVYVHEYLILVVLSVNLFPDPDLANELEQEPEGVCFSHRVHRGEIRLFLTYKYFSRFLALKSVHCVQVPCTISVHLCTTEMYGDFPGIPV